MKSSIMKRASIEGMLFLVILLVTGFASAAWGAPPPPPGFPWQVNDVAVCSTGGNCAVLRINGTSLQLLNTLTDGLGGAPAAAGTNNTLHLLVTDTGTNPNNFHTGSNIVKWSIASVDPATGLAVPHTVLNTFDGSNGGSGLSITGLAISGAGHMFAGNNGNPFTIVEINQDRPAWKANFAYALNFTIVDPALHVQKVTNAGTSAGPNPPTFDDNGGQTFDGTVTWKDQGLSVSSFTLSTNITTPGWAIGTIYPITSSTPNVNQILDPNGHIQQVLTPGKSGSLYPPFNQSSGTTNDNAVTWTDQGGWTANTTYAAGATVGDTNSHLWEATSTTGISGPGPTAPPFTSNDLPGSGTTIDGLTWTNTGPPPGSPPPVWMPNTQYFTVGAQVLDSNGNVELVGTPGTSGPGSTPTGGWNATLNGTTIDNAVMWGDQNSFAWQASHAYTQATSSTDPNGVVVDPSGHVQKVVAAADAGTSGPFQPGTTAPTPPNPNPWTDGASPFGGKTIDGLQWHDAGATSATTDCIENQLNSLDLDKPGTAVYFTSNSGIIQKVSGIPFSGSSTCKVFKNFGPNVTLHGIKVLPPSSMPMNCTSSATPSASCPNGNGGILVAASGTQFVDTDNDLPPSPDSEATPNRNEFSSGEDIQDVCTGLSLTPTDAPPGPSAPTSSCALLLDASDGHIVARYPLTAQTGVDAQALTLDPLVSDCSTPGSCTTTSPVPSPSVANFWLADANSAKFFKVPFTRPASPPDFTTFNASAACPACSAGLNGITIYGGEGANQADLTKLFAGNLTPTAATQVVKFPLPITTANTNTWTVTGTTLLAGNTPATLFGSLIDLNTGYNDGGVQCTPTTSDTSKCIVWKADVPLIPPAGLAVKFTAPTGITTATDVFVDEQYDVTTFVGNLDPGGGRISVHSLHDITNNGTPEVDEQCKYVSPVPKCFQSPSNITFKFTCNLLPGAQLQNFANGHPRLEIVQRPFPLPNPPPAPTCTGSAPGGPPSGCTTQLKSNNSYTAYRFDPANLQFVFNWVLTSANNNHTFYACTYDDTHVALPLCQQFSDATSCKQ